MLLAKPCLPTGHAGRTDNEVRYNNGQTRWPMGRRLCHTSELPDRASKRDGIET